MQYLTIRPKLAEELTEQGYKCERAKHPFNAARTSWVFDLDKKGIEYVKRWLARIGKPLIIPSAEYLDGLKLDKKNTLIKRANAISARTVAARCLPDKMQNGRCDCLACGMKKGIVFTDNGKFYCEKCNASGTSIGFVMLAGLSSEEAAKRICEEFGV